MDKSAADSILAHYPHASRFQKWHMRGRLHLCPYDALLGHITGEASVLDIGCGFGHMAWYLAEHKPALAYFGSDVDERKVALAAGCSDAESGGGAGRPPRPEFRAGDITDHDGAPSNGSVTGNEAAGKTGWPRSFGNILLLDVLYLLPWERQLRVLAWALDHLDPGKESALIIKSMEAPRGAAGLRAVGEEWIMVHLLRKTRSSGTLLGARPARDYAEFGKARGFRSRVEDLATFNPSYVVSLRR